MSALPASPAAYAFAASPCGGLRTDLNGTAVTLRASGALWLEQQRTLVVADLHLEKGSAYAMRGQMLPPYDTRDTLRRLQAEVLAAAPDAVVLLGHARPIGEPVFSHGPFVMTTREEIIQAIQDYQAGKFGPPPRV